MVRCPCKLKQKFGSIALKTPIWEDQAKIIGYEIFIKENEVAQNTYERRVWWMKNSDRDLDSEGVYKNNHPCEAVLPESISVGEESKSPKIIRATLS